MKKTSISLIAVLVSAMAATSCSSELSEFLATDDIPANGKQQMTFTATQESDEATTRTAINSANKVEWSSDDVVAIWDGTAINSFTVEPSTSKTNATLTGETTSGSSKFVALYPYSVGKKCTYTSDKITDVVIPDVQTATLNSYDPAAAVMTATTTSAENNFEFHNVCSFLKITTTKEYMGIVVLVNTGNIAGTFSCSNFTTAPTLTATSGKQKIIVLPKIGSTTLEAGTYYIALAPGSFTGLTVDCYTTTTKCDQKISSNTFTFDRSKCYNLGTTDSWTTDVDAEFLNGGYSVSGTKRVMFTTGNLYWNGSDYHLEASQIGSSRDADNNPIFSDSHVSYFYWTNLTDYLSGTDAYMPYSSNSYSYESQTKDDKFWCGIENPLMINNIRSLYVLTNEEWKYLINTRTHADNLYKYNVTVTDNGKNYANCFIIAPDNFDYITNPLLNSYTLQDIIDLGLTCLPAVGNTTQYKRNNVDYIRQIYQTEFGSYWSSTPSDDTEDSAYALAFGPEIYGVQTGDIENRYFGQCIRLVYTYTGE